MKDCSTNLQEISHETPRLPQIPVTAMIPPGHWELFKMAIDLAQAGALTPLNDNERKVAEEIASTSDPIFSQLA